MSTYILKRKFSIVGENPSWAKNMIDGDVYNKPGNVLSGSGTVKSLARGLASPAAVGTLALDSAKSNIIDKPLNTAIDTVNNHVTKVQNAYVPQQKSYGLVQAAKEIGTGVGKGLWNWGKKNTNTLKGLTGFGAALGAGGYATNRIKRRREEIDNGVSNPGMTTGEKITAGAAMLGSAALAARSGANSWEKSMDVAKKVAEGKATNPNGSLIKGAGKYFRGPDKILDKKTNTYKTITSVDRAKDAINKLNKGKLGMSGKTTRMAVRGGLAGLAVGGAGLLAAHVLNKPANSSQKEYSIYGVVGRIAKGTYNKVLSKAGPNAGIIDKAKAGLSAAGSGIQVGARMAARKASNFFTPGKGGASGILKEVNKGLRDSGEYGKKTADFLSRHKTGAALVTAGTVGSAAFGLTNDAGEKGVKVITDTLDKKTADYTKRTSNENEYGG